MIWTLTIPGRPQTVNAMMKMVPHARSDVKAPWRENAAAAIAEREPIIRAVRPVTVTATPHLQGQRRQDVGACYLIAKACIDGMTDAGVFPDDDDEHVVALTFRPAAYGCAEDSLVLEIEEVGS